MLVFASMDVTQYLQRISYPGEVHLDLPTVRALAIAHLNTVPFENFDIHLGTPISLDTDSLFKKIVTDNRGGYCFELNALFGALLRSIGFTVSFLAARVFGPDNDGLAFDHLSLRVSLEDQDYLVDVGFGDGFHAPLALRTGETSAFAQHDFHISSSGENFKMTCLKDGKLRKGLAFDLQSHDIDEFESMNHYHSCNPSSWWTQELVATKATTTGRIALVGRRLTTRDSVETCVRELNDADYIETLSKEFGIQIPYIPRPKARSMSMRLHRLAQVVYNKVRRLLH